MSIALRFFPVVRSTFMALAMCAAVVQAEARFSQTLSPANWVGAGFVHLSTPQSMTLDALIQRDIDSARQGETVAFSKSFTARLTPDEWRRAGIDQLTELERARLDSVVAAAIADRPTATLVQARSKAAEKADIQVEKPHLTVHGDVSLFIGGGSGGRSWYGGGFDVFVTDPSGHFTAAFGASEVHGRGPGCDLGRGPIW